MPKPWAVLVGSPGPGPAEAELRELGRRGATVLRAPAGGPPGVARPALVAAALAGGFAEMLLVDGDVSFRPGDAEALRSHGLPLACGLLPDAGRRGFDCEFLNGTASVAFGLGGGLLEVRTARLGFALVRRAALEAMRPLLPPDRPPAWLLPMTLHGPAAARELDADAAFCELARRAGVRVVADTRVRLLRVAPYAYSWEEAGRDPERFARYDFHLGGPPAPAAPERPALRGVAGPLPPGFPRVEAFVVTYPANRDSLAATLESLRASDWGVEPAVIDQPAGHPPSREAGVENYRRALETAAAADADFSLVLEDDVRVGRHLRRNIAAHPLVRRDQCDYLGLFAPDLIADPWERCEPALGYRAARPRFVGPDAGWERSRLWGSQALLLSRRLVRAALAGWGGVDGCQDARVLGACALHGVEPFYTLPCLAEHAPVRSAYGTPVAYAPDFDADFRLESPAGGFEPPEAVPGRLMPEESRQLWRLAAGLDALEAVGAAGRPTVCLAQSASRVVSAGDPDAAGAAEWLRRYGLSGRVEFRAAGPGDRFGLAFLDPEGDEAAVGQSVAAALAYLRPGGVLAVAGYPDPQRPGVRPAVDALASRLGWRRLPQAGFLGAFRT